MLEQELAIVLRYKQFDIGRATVAKFDSLPIEYFVVPMVGWEVFVEERQERLSNVRQHTCVVRRIKLNNFPLPLSTILPWVVRILDALLKATFLECYIIIRFHLAEFRFILQML